MPENTRVKISSVVKNQLPDFIRGDFPLAGDFLEQYYTAIENQGSTLDILQNIDKSINALLETRPTAINLRWAISYIFKKIKDKRIQDRAKLSFELL